MDSHYVFQDEDSGNSAYGPDTGIVPPSMRNGSPTRKASESRQAANGAPKSDLFEKKDDAIIEELLDNSNVYEGVEIEIPEENEASGAFCQVQAEASNEEIEKVLDLLPPKQRKAAKKALKNDGKTDELTISEIRSLEDAKSWLNDLTKDEWLKIGGATAAFFILKNMISK